MSFRYCVSNASTTSSTSAIKNTLNGTLLGKVSFWDAELILEFLWAQSGEQENHLAHFRLKDIGVSKSDTIKSIMNKHAPKVKL